MAERKRPPLDSNDYQAMWTELRGWLERMQCHVALQDTMSSMETGRYRRNDGS